MSTSLFALLCLGILCFGGAVGQLAVGHWQFAAVFGCYALLLFWVCYDAHVRLLPALGRRAR